MSQQPFTPPEIKKSAYHCPCCGAYSAQLWGKAYASRGNNSGQIKTDEITIGWCIHCKSNTIWVDKELVYPEARQAPLPNEDLPEDIKVDYEEAVLIIGRSLRGAAALLRLCIQKLCKHLGESGKNINNDIAELVKKGLNPTIQKSLDIVRVVGNEAVHPGTIDIKDNPKTSIILCQLINIIADGMITQPKMIEGLYSSLPEEKRDQIKKRDQ
ncbi:MAG: hypothetical protein COB14_05320 [Alphaproteobacteria bacterium]|nr:MAG: hypothetical protein COB14_05320 [Alphaproteobacteria bacterium]